MIDELKPCPFCKTNLLEEFRGGVFHKQVFGGSPCPLFGLAIEKKNWNTRPREDALEAEIAHLKADIHISKDVQAVQAITQQRDDLASKCMSLQAETERQQAEVATQQDCIARQDTRIKTMEAHGEHFEEDMLKLEAEVATLRLRVSTLEPDLYEAKLNKERLMKRCATLRALVEASVGYIEDYEMGFTVDHVPDGCTNTYSVSLKAHIEACQEATK